MNDRVKEIILKLLLLFEIALLITLFPGLIFISFITPTQELFDVIFYTVLGLILLDGVLFLILCPLFGGIKKKQTRAEKIPLMFDNYSDLKVFLDCSLKNNGYKKKVDSFSFDDTIITFYQKSRWNKTLDCFVLIKVDQLSDFSMEKINNCISKMIIEQYDNKIITYTVNMIGVFCVDRISNSFNKLVNNNIEQGLKNGRLPIGISFGGKNIYIARQQGGFAIMRYKRLRKEFFNIITGSQSKETEDGSAVFNDK